EGALDAVIASVLSPGAARAPRVRAPTGALGATAAAIVTAGQSSHHQTQTQNVTNRARHGAFLIPKTLRFKHTSIRIVPWKSLSRPVFEQQPQTRLTA